MILYEKKKTLYRHAHTTNMTNNLNNGFSFTDVGGLCSPWMTLMQWNKSDTVNLAELKTNLLKSLSIYHL